MTGSLSLFTEYIFSEYWRESEKGELALTFAGVLCLHFLLNDRKMELRLSGLAL